jgi:sarcosine oxidase
LRRALSTQPKPYDCIVAGLGAAGSAALYHAAKRSPSVLGIEQHTIAHSLGSSHGESRIIRLAYFESPKYVPILKRSYALWRELEVESRQQLLLCNGGIDAGPIGSDLVNNSAASCMMHNLPHERLSAAQVNKRWPGFRLPATYEAVFQAESGILQPERCVQAHVAGAKRRGATVRENERILSVRPAGAFSPLGPGALSACLC